MDLVEVRRHLESAIAALAAERATPLHVAVMEEANRQLIAAHAGTSRSRPTCVSTTCWRKPRAIPSSVCYWNRWPYLLRLSLKQTLSRDGCGTGRRRATEKILAAVGRGDPAAARQAMLDLVAMSEIDLGIKEEPEGTRTQAG